MMPGDPGRLGVLVTRPARQCQPLCKLLEGRSWTPVPWPAIEIEVHDPDSDVVAALRAAGPRDIAVFVSRNAVSYGSRLLATPPAIPVGAIGPSTRQALVDAGFTLAFESPGFDTEALLANPGLADLSGRRVFIFRGVGGREALREGLAARGAQVLYVEVYRRRIRTSSPAERRDLLERWQSGGIGVYTATSVEILEALHSDLGPEFASLLSATPLVTASRRVVQRSQELQHRAERILAPGPDDRSLVDAIASWSGRLRDPAVRQERER